MTRASSRRLGAASSLAVALLAGLGACQTPVGKEVHPELTTYRCTLGGGCVEATNYVVLDALAHAVHPKGKPEGSCANAAGDGVDPKLCPDVDTCQDACVQEGIEDYNATAGVTTEGAALHLRLFADAAGKNEVAPRVYLLDKTKERYEMTKFLGGEVAFTTDVSALPCGMNGALYTVEMDRDGGRERSGDAKTGGAYWGAGYCDAQCFKKPFIHGVANIHGRGACCAEMDLWEANSRSQQLAPHPCRYAGFHACKTEAECGGDAATGVCDKSGCGWNPYALNQTSYYGRGRRFDVDTTRPFTVVTQFPVDETTGKLIEIRRLYTQDGYVIKTEAVPATDLGITANNRAVDAITGPYCKAVAGGKPTSFEYLGGLAAMGEALERGMALAASVWWDKTKGSWMGWLDGQEEGTGPCAKGEGDPKNVVKKVKNPHVVFRDFKWGELGSTFTEAQRKMPSKMAGRVVSEQDAAHADEGWQGEY